MQNEIVVDYGIYDVGAVYRVIASAAVGGPRGDDERYVANTACALSQSRYGVVSAGCSSSPGTWDRPTAVAVAHTLAERLALRSRLVSAFVPDGRGLDTGDVVLVTDDEVGLADEVAIVVEPPVVRRTGADVTFRLPAR